MPRSYRMSLAELQPTQLFINSGKLAEVLRWSSSEAADSIEPVPVHALGDATILTDGHTRAYAAYRQGHNTVPTCWDTDDLDWEAYAICVEWCREEG